MRTIADELRDMARAITARADALVVLDKTIGELAMRPMVADANKLYNIAVAVEDLEQDTRKARMTWGGGL